MPWNLIYWLICVGVILWALNSIAAPHIHPPILKVINVLVTVVIILLAVKVVFGLLGAPVSVNP